MSAKEQEKSLPETVYGYWNKDSGDDPDEWFLSVDQDPAGLVEKGEQLRVGIYKLVGYADVKNETKVVGEQSA